MARIHVDISHGVVEIEGEESFVAAIFKELRPSLGDLGPLGVHRPNKSELPQAAPAVENVVSTSKEKAKPKPKSKPSAAASAAKGGIGTYYKGTLDPSIDLSKLADFHKRYGPTSNAVRNLVFAAYMREVAGRNPCSANDIYSCYFNMKSQVKIPEAFGKNLRDSRSEGYVSYQSDADISITTIGENKLIELEKKANGG